MKHPEMLTRHSDIQTKNNNFCALILVCLTETEPDAAMKKFDVQPIKTALEEMAS